MEKKEKVELLLEQMRLCLARKDYIRAQIIAKKISVRFFEDESSEVSMQKYLGTNQYNIIGKYEIMILFFYKLNIMQYFHNIFPQFSY